MQQMVEDVDPLRDLLRTLLHQTIVGGNIGFAFGGVDNQGANAAQTALQFSGGGKAGAAQPGDTGLMEMLNQFGRRCLTVIGEGAAFAPAVLTVGNDNDAELGQPGRVIAHMLADGVHRPGGRRVHRQHPAGTACQRLSPQHRIAGFDAQVAFRPEVLLERDNQIVRHRNLPQRYLTGLGFHFRGMNSA